MIEVFSSGGGTQSACITALIVQGILPKPDLTVIADTERERSSVWEYLNAVIRPALQGVGIEVHRISCKEYGYAKDSLFNKSGTLLIPAYSNLSGQGKLSNFCSTYWKIEAVDNWLSRERGIKRADFKKWIGFSMDEGRRFTRMSMSAEGIKGLIRFPLIQDVPLRRQQAIREVEKMGWPTPPRSACWMCPNQGDHEWRDLKLNQPHEFQKAVELEREIHAKDPNAFLHSSCVPLDEVDFSVEPELFDTSSHCNSGACFV